MAKNFDKVVKELFAHMQYPLLETFFGIRVIAVKQLDPNIQHTIIAKEADTVAEVKFPDGKLMVMHIEWQTTNDAKMVDRMLFYHVLLRSRYAKPVLGLVIYLGKASMRMKREIEEPGLSYQARMLDMKELRPGEFLSSPDPAHWVFAILAGHQQDKTLLIREIISKLQTSFSNDTETLQIKLSQLEILSLLRGRHIQEQVLKEGRLMGTIIDIKKDLRYQEGMANGMKKGIQKGVEKGVEQGSEQKALEVVTRLLQTGSFTIAQIAEFAGVEESFVNRIEESMHE